MGSISFTKAGSISKFTQSTTLSFVNPQKLGEALHITIVFPMLTIEKKLTLEGGIKGSENFKIPLALDEFKLIQVF
jgi:hypothetical protein